MPHLALPALTSFLRSHGVDVVQRDLNLETYDAILSRKHLEQAIGHLREEYGPDAQRRPSPDSKASDGRCPRPGLVPSGCAKKFSAALPSTTGKELEGFEILVQALELASVPFYPRARPPEL